MCSEAFGCFMFLIVSYVMSITFYSDFQLLVFDHYLKELPMQCSIWGIVSALLWHFCCYDSSILSYGYRPLPFETDPQFIIQTSYRLFERSWWGWKSFFIIYLFYYLFKFVKEIAFSFSPLKNYYDYMMIFFYFLWGKIWKSFSALNMKTFLHNITNKTIT